MYIVSLREQVGGKKYLKTPKYLTLAETILQLVPEVKD